MNALFGYRSVEPEQCGLCGRCAGYVGCIEKSGDLVLYLCELCNARSGLKVIEMGPKKIEEVEALGLMKAAEETSPDLITAVLTTMWNDGVTSLEELDADRLEAVRAKLTSSPDFVNAMKKLLLSYSAAMRFEVARSKA